ncbi:phospholipid-transporting ATPase IK isoform X3 [Symphalangus syndactylus]|uniref:phospholipid-transporting ATPase IK isoform X3 n=1 Tax=Symphalangus syndactylus TaxID=9590 RepID=UPI003003B366
MGDSPDRGAPQRRHKAQAGRVGKYEQRLEGPTSMGSLGQREDLQDEDRNSATPGCLAAAFTWEVQANNRAYNAQFKEKVFLCWRRKKYKTNVVRTAKYSFFSFLPLNLYEQFHRVSNLYFLLIIILQSIPDISTLPWFSLGAPMVCLLFIRAARDLVDDISSGLGRWGGQGKSEEDVGAGPWRSPGGSVDPRGVGFKWKKWQDLCVGDVVCLRKDNIVPADVLLLASTEPSSLCYVETVDIDGETNLKFRQALMVTHKELTTTKKMASFQGTVMCEAPNSRMHHFVGCLEWNDKKYSLDIGNLLLRGCRIRNTDTCYGLVIYAGFDTKIMKNCGKIHLKRTKLDLLMNKLVVVILISVVLVCLVLAFSFGFSVKEFKDHHYYLSGLHGSSVAAESFFTFWGFLILLSVTVPMSMFILSEFIYLGNSIFIDWDVQMYYKPQDVPAKARSTSLNDHLGQVEYIFSDKTGTLTQNILTFNKCCINGRVYGPDSEATTRPKENPYLWNKFADGKLLFHNAALLHLVRSNRDEAVREFWRLLAICHTVMVRESHHQLLYQAACPDEEALVTAARNFGYVFLSRTQDTITIVELGEERVYQVLAIMDFNSMRKRMSVLVRKPEGTICLYTKGADTVIFERLHRRGATEFATEEALAAFAQETLRTLCLAYREVAEDIYEDWQQRHQEASLLLQNRAQALQQVYNKMEQNLKLLGATAIEDRLQDGVPETIKCLKKSNIKIWVLTGDKQETAVNVGFACELLSENMLILEEKEISRILETYRENSNNLLTKKSLSQVKLALVINGDFLDKLLVSLRKEPRALVQNVNMDEAWQEPGQSRRDFLYARRLSLLRRRFGLPLAAPLAQDSGARRSSEVLQERAFVDLASKCQAVICCRVTPKQKALIVALVKKYHQVVTLAIGDGANDINMIKTADVGVGLAGQEGMQAVQNSDFVLGQFCFLQRLLLVHGRWSYVRICKFLRYSFYKTMASMMVQPLYEGWFLALFNLLYSTLPVLYIGLFEQDVSAEQSLEKPELYVAGQKDELFNYWVFVQAIAHGVTTSLVNFFMTLWISRDTAGPASFSDHQSFAVVVALSCLLSITMEVILIIKYWTALCVATILLSLGFYAVMTTTTQSFWLFRVSPKTFPFLYADLSVLSSPSILLVVLLSVSINTVPVLALRVIFPALKELRAKEEKVEEGPSEDIFTVEPLPHVYWESCARRSSYAFSHHEGYADLITQGTILRRGPGVSSDIASESLDLSDEEASSSPKESHWHLRKKSFLGKKKCQPQGLVSSQEVQHLPTPSSSFSMDRQSALHSENQRALPKYVLTSTNRLSGSFQEQLPRVQERPLSPKQRPPSPEKLLLTKERSQSLQEKPPLHRESQPSSSESQSQPLGSQPLLSGQLTLESQPDSSEEKSAFLKPSTPFWKSWQKEPHTPKEGTVPLPDKTHKSQVETRPPSLEESSTSTSEQPMEVEPWPAEKQSSSSMEWLLVPGEEQPSLPPEEQSLPSAEGTRGQQ